MLFKKKKKKTLQMVADSSEVILQRTYGCMSTAAAQVAPPDVHEF